MQRRGELLTVLSSVFWGSSFAAVKLGLNYSGIYWFLLQRFILASLVGITILSVSKGITISYYRRRDILAFLAGLVWAFYIVKVRQLMTRTETSTSQLTVALLACTTVSLVLPTLGLESNYATPSASLLFAVYAGVFCTAVPLLLWSEGLRHITATVSSIVLLLEILFAFAFSVPLGLENLQLLDVVGGAFILLSIFLATWERPLRGYLKNSISLPTPRETAKS